MNVIALLSSLATLILFALYFFGRVKVMEQSMKIAYEEIYICYNSEEYDKVIAKTSGIAGSCNLSSDIDGRVKIVFLPLQPVYDFGIYEIKYDDDTLTSYKVSDENLIKGYFFNQQVISPGAAVVIHVDYLSDTYPSHMLKYKRFDYMNCQYAIISNEHGGLAAQLINTTYTRQGFIYNMVK